MKPPSCSLFPRGEGRGEGQRRSQTIIRDYRNGRDLTGTPRGVKVIDLFGLIAQLVRERFPAVYQPLLEPAHLVTGRLRAYGLGPGQSTDALLTHLVALNAQRAGEEKAGHVRWLRPEFQSPALATLLLNKELVTLSSQAVQADLALNFHLTMFSRLSLVARQLKPGQPPCPIKCAPSPRSSPARIPPCRNRRSKRASKAAVRGRRVCRASSTPSKQWGGRGARVTGGGAKGNGGLSAYSESEILSCCESLRIGRFFCAVTRMHTCNCFVMHQRRVILKQTVLPRYGR